ncbi:MAG TPA: sigma-54-dependent Fis family transcriptional regulator [bacterium]|nr:sigma-54-dependent Fis family transcriptional regulator [bacterium]
MIGVAASGLVPDAGGIAECFEESTLLQPLAYVCSGDENPANIPPYFRAIPVIAIRDLVSLSGLDLVVCGTSKAQDNIRSLGLKGVLIVGPESLPLFSFLITRLSHEISDLIQAKLMLASIIDATQDAISVVDEKGNGILVNPAYTRLTGLTQKDVLGKPATVDIAEGESTHFKVLSTGKPVQGARLKVGPRKKDVIVNVAPIIVHGKLRGSVGVIHDVSQIKRLTEELAQAKRRIRHLEAKYTFEDIIGESPEMQAAVDQAKRAADLPATVLLRGESGTGKELFAHAIHNASRWRTGQFVRVSCTAIAESLLESELFGYEEGAFTGARKQGKKGYFEEAVGGTIFLDEIGEISPALQAKLLRVLQEKEIVRVGGTLSVPVNTRIIAATNANLEQAVHEGSFREDLYYRLNVVPILIPPLRYRKDDVPPLVAFLLRKFNQQFGRAVEKVAPQALSSLVAYDWPGNVRELENILGRAMINMKYNETIMKSHHLPTMGGFHMGAKAVYGLSYKHWAPGKTLAQLTAIAEKNAVEQALAHAKGNKTLAAKLLDISPRTLYYKLDKYGITI